MSEVDYRAAYLTASAEAARIHPRLAAIQNLSHPDQPAAAAADPGQVALFNLTGGAV